MKVNSRQLIEELTAITLSNLKAAENFRYLDTRMLNHKPSPTSWSIPECLEHLNRYGSFYLPEINKHLQRHRPENRAGFKSGFIGNYFVKMVIPNNKTTKIKTFKAMNPAGSILSTEVLDAFINNQRTLLSLLEKAGQYNLNTAGIPVTFTKLVKLKLGDILRFMVYHNQRHIQQAQRCLHCYQQAL